MREFTKSLLMPYEYKAISYVYRSIEIQTVSRPWLGKLVVPVVFGVELAKAAFMPILALEGVALTAIKLACQPSLNTAWKLCTHTFTAIIVTGVLAFTWQARVFVVVYAALETYKKMPIRIDDLADVAEAVSNYASWPIIQEMRAVLVES